MTTISQETIFQNSEAIVNWTFPGAALYYRDCELAPDIVSKFTANKIIRNGYFLDVSNKADGLPFNTRFLVASSKAAKMYEVNPNVERYGHCCINANSFFKILDVYTIGDKTQVFLLHIPAKGVLFFKSVSSNLEKEIIEKARKNFEMKAAMPPNFDLTDRFWLERTNFPPGMDGHNKLYPPDKLTPLPPAGEPLFSAIRTLTNDDSDLNIPTPFSLQAYGSEGNSDSGKKSFWKRLFGK